MAVVVGADFTYEDAVQSAIERGVAKFDRRDLLDAHPAMASSSARTSRPRALAPADLKRVVHIEILGTAWVLTYSRPHIVRRYGW
jgi:NAD(P)-dependent dehydrogenase (short-subunit alcohol dehydrogenase family)